MQLRAISLVLLALAWFACQSYTIRKSLNPDELSGQYYKGDHLGYNVDLILAASGTYSARLYGDVGEYGTWQGHWSIEGNLIALQPPIELKLGKKRFVGDRLLVGDYKGRIFLADSPPDDYFLQYGPNVASAFFRGRADDYPDVWGKPRAAESAAQRQ